MASLVLRRALFSITKPLSFVVQHTAKYSSISAFVNVCTQSALHRNIMGFRSPLFLADSQLPYVQQTFGMKTKSAIKKRCKDCYIVRRRGRLFVYCKSNGKHKQRQG